MTNTINIFKLNDVYAFSVLPHDSEIKYAESIADVAQWLIPIIRRMLIPGLKIIINFPPDSHLNISKMANGRVVFVNKRGLSETEQEELKRKLMVYDLQK